MIPRTAGDSVQAQERMLTRFKRVMRDNKVMNASRVQRSDSLRSMSHNTDPRYYSVMSLPKESMRRDTSTRNRSRFDAGDAVSLLCCALLAAIHFGVHLLVAIAAGMDGPRILWPLTRVLQLPIAHLSHPYGPSILNSTIWGATIFLVVYLFRRYSGKT